MKSINFYKAFLLGILIAGFSGIVKSQTCSIYYPLTNGSSWSMTNYDAKGKVDGTSDNLVTRSTTSTEGTIATIQTTSKDKKDSVSGTMNTSIKCTGGKVYIDMKSFVPTNPQYKNMDIKSDATWLEIPETLTVGMKLTDGIGTMTIYNNGTVFSTMKVSITNRTVASKESITTAAGTFDCFKVTEDVKMEMTVMGMTVPTNAKTVEYYCANTGLVKSMTYDKNNKLVGYSELTKITKK